MPQTTFGRDGEERAAVYLEKLGYEIIARNFRIRGGELDLIALDGNVLVFVEVKSRKNFAFGSPLEFITPKKLHDVIRAVEGFRKYHPDLPDNLRFDAIEILKFPGREIEISHVKNITM